MKEKERTNESKKGRKNDRKKEMRKQIGARCSVGVHQTC